MKARTLKLREKMNFGKRCIFKLPEENVNLNNKFFCGVIIVPNSVIL